MSNPFLSIIMPAYNEEERLPGTLTKTIDFLLQQPYSWELIVVENGSHDRTYEIAQEYANLHPQVRVIHENKKDKGLAIQRGMLNAMGKYRLMSDADFSIQISEVNRFIPPFLDADIAIASRQIKNAIRQNEPLYRYFGSHLINLMIRLSVLPGFKDTQCGFKCFRASVAEDLFNKMSITGWSFDIEIIYIARLHGYRIVELPVTTYYYSGSKVNPITVTIQMVLDIITIWRYARAGIYK